MTRKTPAQLDREIAEVLTDETKPEHIKLKDRYSGGHIVLTVRNGNVVGAMGSDPKRYVGLTLDQAKHHARYGGEPPIARATQHARKKKLSPHEAKQLLKSDGIDFQRDFHELGSQEVERVLEVAHLVGYRKRKDAPGSTARMYFQYLSRLK